MQPKKDFSLVDYNKCNPDKCSPDEGVCIAAKSCTYKVIKQIDGKHNPPIVFQDICMGCRDCIEACPLDAIEMKHIT